MTESIPDGPTRTDRLRLATQVLRILGQRAGERLRPPRVVDPSHTPPTLDAITPEWLQATVYETALGIEVRSFTWSGQTDGTSSRRRLQVDLAPGAPDDAPQVMFAKAAPTLATRLTTGLSRTAVTEAGFYRELRPQLVIEAPIAHHCSVDERRNTSVQVLEDLEVTKAATFCDATNTSVTRTMAEQMIDVLADLHTASASMAMAARAPRWLNTYRAWWDRNCRLADMRRSHARGLRDAKEFVAPSLRGRADETWAAFRSSVAEHGTLPTTVIHGDVHLGNWYRTGEGSMGLLDWQCPVVAHPSRDVAYCLASACDVDDRRVWERDLVLHHASRMRSAGFNLDDETAFTLYRRQLAGALLMWTPTYTPPPFFPEMQPREIAAIMVRRITTAMEDHDTFDALR